MPFLYSQPDRPLSMCPIWVGVIGATPASQGLHFFLASPSDISLIWKTSFQDSEPRRTRRIRRNALRKNVQPSICGGNGMLIVSYGQAFDHCSLSPSPFVVLRALRVLRGSWSSGSGKLFKEGDASRGRWMRVVERRMQRV